MIRRGCGCALAVPGFLLMVTALAVGTAGFTDWTMVPLLVLGAVIGVAWSLARRAGSDDARLSSGG